MATVLRMRGLEKATQYGVSMFSWRVFGKPRSARPSDPLGFEVESAKPVLKEGVACALSARAWLGGDRFRPVEAVWSSEDGTFAGNSFTPSKGGFATVRARFGGLTLEKKLPVEEAQP